MLNKNFFILPLNENLVAWDFLNHKQYILDENDIKRIFAHRKSTTRLESRDYELLEAGLISDQRSDEKWGWDPLSRIFHLGTNHPSNLEERDPTDPYQATQSYLDFCSSIHENEPSIELIKGGKPLKLPKPELVPLKSASLLSTLKRRKTCRDFEKSPIRLETVSDLLHITFGENKADDFDVPFGIQRFGYRRTSPSAGSLQACEAYLWADEIEGLPKGIYHYISTQHSLEVVKGALPEISLSRYLCNQHWADDLPFAIFITINFAKLWWKHPHSRAYRPALIDVGHLSQTLNLAITAYNLYPWMTGYFIDRELNDVLDANGENEHVIFMIGAGHGTGSPYTRELFDICEKKQ